VAVPLALDIADDRAEGGGSHAVEPSVSSSCGSPANENHYPARRPPAEPAPASTLYEEFHPFGTTSYAANDSGIEVSAKRYRYIGKERDEETGLYHLGARYYASWLGRWTGADPIGLGDGVNRYAYAQGNPVRLFDTSGFKGQEIRLLTGAAAGDQVYRGPAVDSPRDGDISPQARSAIRDAFQEEQRVATQADNLRMLRSQAHAAGVARRAAASEARAQAEAEAIYNDPSRELKLEAARQALGAATATVRTAVGVLSFGLVGFDEFKDAEAQEAETHSATSAFVEFGSVAAPVAGKVRAGTVGGAGGAPAKLTKASPSEPTTQPASLVAEQGVGGGPRFVYRGGSATPDNLTPRPGVDTTGISTFDSLEAAIGPGGKAQKIDLQKVGDPLVGVPDAPPPGHVSVRPGAELTADVVKAIEDWAATRGTGGVHPYTQSLLDAIVETVRRPKG